MGVPPSKLKEHVEINAQCEAFFRQNKLVEVEMGEIKNKETLTNTQKVIVKGRGFGRGL